MTKLSTFIALAFLAASASAAEENSDSGNTGEEKCPRIQASTVFVAEKGRKGSAEELTDSHKNAEAQGWDFSSLVLYTENNDLEGFYVTYTRPHPCNKE